MKSRVPWLTGILTAAVLQSVSYAASDTVPGNFVAQRQEPKFSVMKYADLPGSIKMTVRLSSEDIIESVQARFPQLRAERSHVSMEGEELVSSGGKYFRRVRLYNLDLEARTYHGRCGQWIAVWFQPDGTELGVYFDAPGCPL